MIIGILSDTHDNLPKIKKAVEVFNANKVSLVLHAGDIVAPFSLIPLDDLRCDYIGVYGNNDGEKRGLGLKSKGRIKDGPLIIKKENRTIHISHDLPQKIDKKKFDLVISGHSHKPGINLDDKTLFVNPGECCGWLSGKSTIAICNLTNLACHILEI